jgi:hypothetical protein
MCIDSVVADAIAGVLVSAPQHYVSDLWADLESGGVCRDLRQGSAAQEVGRLTSF